MDRKSHLLTLWMKYFYTQLENEITKNVLRNDFPAVASGVDFGSLQRFADMREYMRIYE